MTTEHAIGVPGVRSLLDRALEERIGSAYAFSFGNADGVVERGVGGAARHDGPTVDEGALWDLASLTKAFVGLAFARLVASGSIHTRQTVAHFLADFAESPSAAVSVRQLLTHSGGLPGRQPLYRTCIDGDEIRRAVRELPLRGEPGTRCEYSSQGFMILGWVLETVTGLSVANALDDLVLRPFGLNETHFRAIDAKPEGTVSTEDSAARNGLIHGTVHDENTYIMGGSAGHAGLFSSLSDMETLGLTLLEIHLGREDGPISPHLLHTWTRNYTRHTGGARAMAFQLASDPDAPAGDLFSPNAFGHTGFTGTSLFIDPELKCFGVLLTNRVHPRRDDERITDLTNCYFNLVAASCDNS